MLPGVLDATVPCPVTCPLTVSTRMSKHSPPLQYTASLVAALADEASDVAIHTATEATRSVKTLRSFKIYPFGLIFGDVCNLLTKATKGKY